jgi:O-antigen/teichoic acid export membrane protein
MAFELPLRAFIGTLSAQLRFDVIASLQILTLILRTAAIIIVLISGYQILEMALVTVLATIPEKILTIYFARKNLPQVRFNFDAIRLSTSKMLISYSLYTFFWKIADILKFHVDVIVITSFLGLSAVTHYKIGSMFALHMQSFMGALIGFMMPVFARYYGKKDSNNIENSFFFVNKVSIYISVFMSFGLIFWGEPFIERWMGLAYLDAYPVLFILVIASLIAFIQVPSIELLLSADGYKFVGIVNVIEGLINLILSIVLVKYFGIIGVALGTLIPITIVKLFIQPFYVIRCLKYSYTQYFKKLGKAIIVSFLSLIIPVVLTNLLIKSDYFSLVFVGTISMVLYGAGILVFGFNRTEINAILQVIKRENKGPVALKKPMKSNQILLINWLIQQE